MYVSSMSLLQPRSGVFLDVVGLFQNSCVCMEAHSIHTWVHPYYRPTDFLPQTFVTTRLPDYLGGEREREREREGVQGNQNQKRMARTPPELRLVVAQPHLTG
jgi:hypothetical protein